MKKTLFVLLLTALSLYWFKYSKVSESSSLDLGDLQKEHPLTASTETATRVDATPAGTAPIKNIDMSQYTEGSEKRPTKAESNDADAKVRDWLVDVLAIGGEKSEQQKALKTFLEFNPSYSKKLYEYLPGQIIFLQVFQNPALVEDLSTRTSRGDSYSIYQSQKRLGSSKDFVSTEINTFCKISITENSEESAGDQSSLLFEITRPPSIEVYRNENLTGVKITDDNAIKGDRQRSIRSIECFSAGLNIAGAKNIDLKTLLYHLGVRGK